ncbi:uncharacterized protein LOC143934012 isoform X4 [Lithobates pipiens]
MTDLTVTDVPPDSANFNKPAGCSIGSIVGTVLVVVFVLIVAGFLIYYTYKTRNRNNGLSVDTSIQVPIYENRQNTAMDQGASTDSDYTNLQFKSEDIYTALKN